MNEDLESSRQQIQQALENCLPSQPSNPIVLQVMRYSLLADGKRLRPLLMLEIAHGMGHSDQDIIHAACGVECIHTASLILDDLPCMDNASIRRGKPAAHCAFGEATAILGSLALIFHGLHLIQHNANAVQLAASEQTNLLQFLYRRLGLEGMVLGQSLDLSTSKNQNYEIIQQIVEYKTTALFEIAVIVACRLCAASPVQESCLVEYINNIAYAFQLVDDIDDVQGTTHGKAAHQDIGKHNYVQVYGIEAAQKQVNIFLQRAIQALQPLGWSSHLIQFAQKILNVKES